MIRDVTNQNRGDRACPFLPVALALALAVLMIPARARAWAPGTWYVDNTSGKCSDTGLGTQEKPYCSITAALAAHRDSGVTIVVRGGPYRERVSIGSNGSASGPSRLGSDVLPLRLPRRVRVWVADSR